MDVVRKRQKGVYVNKETFLKKWRNARVLWYRGAAPLNDVAYMCLKARESKQYSRVPYRWAVWIKNKHWLESYSGKKEYIKSISMETTIFNSEEYQ